MAKVDRCARFLSETPEEREARHARNVRHGWGGPRPGSGRPKGIPTIRVTIPLRYADALALMIELGVCELTPEALKEAQALVKEQVLLECAQARNRMPPHKAITKLERVRDLAERLYFKAEGEEAKKALNHILALLAAHLE